MQSDFELVQAVLDGQKVCFAELVKRYETGVKAVCRNVLTDSHLSADAAQEAFVKAYEKLATLRNPKRFGPWLMQIARRTAVDIARKQRNDVPLQEQLHAGHAHNNGQLDEDNRELLAAVMRLPGQEKQVIMLRYFDGHSVREVAGMAGRSVGTVTKQLSRAHRRLKTLLSEAEQ